MRTTYKLLLNHLICHLAIIPGVIYGELWMFGIAFVWYYFITICSSSSGYHRYYAHQSFKTGKWFEWTTNFLSLFAGSGPYLTRAAIHRQHHAYVDTPKDPSSPVHNGFWKIYFNVWGLDNRIERRFFKGLIDNEILIFFHRNYWKLVFTVIIILFLIDPLILIFVYCVPCVLNSHFFGLFNAYLHKSGKAINSNWLNLFTAGEGYHKTHHDNSGQLRMGPIDPTYFFIRLIKHD